MKHLPLAIVASLCFSANASAASAYTFRLFASGVIATAHSSVPAVTYAYATWNPADKASGANLSNGNLTESSSLGNGVRATLAKSSGKWYWEIAVNATANGYGPLVGIEGAGAQLVAAYTGPAEYLFLPSQGLRYGAGVISAYGTSVTAGDVIGIAVDLDNRTMMFLKNGVSLGSAYTSGMLPAGTYRPYVSDPYSGSASATSTANFGQTPFKYAVPSGYQAGWFQ